MTNYPFSRSLLLFALLLSATSSTAALVDFTDSSWNTAIRDGGGTSATIGNITLTSTGGNLTFNGGSSERGGCASGQSKGNGLTCNGDGIGVGNDDEITQSGSQSSYSRKKRSRKHQYDTRIIESITISFLDPVNVSNLFLLDLFGSDTESSGEIAVINDLQYKAPDDNNGFAGGFYATGFSGLGISSIVLTGNHDRFSDYALAAVEISPVPLPGALILFGSALLGLFGFKRFS